MAVTSDKPNVDAANSYRQGHTASVVQSHLSRNAANTCGYFTHLIKPTSHILDAGCGPGSVTSSVAELVPQGRAVGVDSSDSVIATATAQPGLPSNCSFVTGSLLKLPFDDATFDIVYTSQVLIHVPDAAAALREMRRVCKPRGFVACREAIIPSVLLWPQHAGLLRWRDVHIGVLDKAGAHHSGGLKLTQWAIDVGFAPANIEYTVGFVTHAGQNRRWYAENVAARVMEDESWRQSAFDKGVAVPADFELMRDGYLAMANDEAGVYSMPCGQVVCHKG